MFGPTQGPRPGDQPSTTHQAPSSGLPSCDNPKYLQTLTKVPWEAKPCPVEDHGLNPLAHLVSSSLSSQNYLP